MGKLYDNIALLCEQHNIKGAKMCTDTGISKGLLTDLKMGRRTGVSAVTAQKIASYFGVSVGYLLGEEETSGVPYARKMVKKLAEERGIGISDIENKLGVNYATFRSWYNGSGDYFNDTTQLEKIADLFGVSVAYLLGEETEETDKKEKPIGYDGLSEKRKALIDFALSVPEDKAEMLLRVMKSIVEGV